MKKKIVVPEGMLKAARETDLPGSLMMILEAALRWLSENPIVPNPEQAKECADAASKIVNGLHQKGCKR